MNERANADRIFGSALRFKILPATPPLAESHESVELHIEELVLHGFAPRDRHRISNAVQQELLRLLETSGWQDTFPEGLTVDRIDAGSIRLRPATGEMSFGKETARSIHNGIKSLSGPK